MYNNGCIVPQIPEILHTVYINPSLLGLYSFELKQVAYIEWESCELIWQIYTVNNSTKCMVVHVLYRSAIPQSDIYCIYVQGEISIWMKTSHNAPVHFFPLNIQEI